MSYCIAYSAIPICGIPPIFNKMVSDLLNVAVISWLDGMCIK